MAENEKKKKGFLSGLLDKADKKMEEKANEEECGCCSCCSPKKNEKGKDTGCCG